MAGDEPALLNIDDEGHDDDAADGDDDDDDNDDDDNEDDADDDSSSCSELLLLIFIDVDDDLHNHGELVFLILLLIPPIPNSDPQPISPILLLPHCIDQTQPLLGPQLGRKIGNVRKAGNSVESTVWIQPPGNFK